MIWALGLSCASVLFVQTWSRAHRPSGIDLTTYLQAAHAIARGGNPYDVASPFPYVYPPFLAFALIPLTYLPEDWTLIMWYAASVAALVWSTREIIRAAYPVLDGRHLTPFVGALFAAAYPVIQSNLRNGQVNLFVLALCIFALRACPTSAAAQVRGATAWAAAIAIKMVPAALGPFYLRRGGWSFGATAVMITTALWLLPILVLGPAMFEQVGAYASSFLAGSFGSGGPVETLDFSVGGMLVRLNPRVPPEWLRVGGAVISLGVATATDLAARPGRSTDAYAFGLYLAVIPLASPKSEVHHLAFALPAVAMTCAPFWYRLAGRRRALVVLVAGMITSYSAAVIFRAAAGELMTLALAALVGALIVLMRGANAQRPASQPGAGDLTAEA